MNQAIIATSRFGYGAGPDGTAAILADGSRVNLPSHRFRRALLHFPRRPSWW